MESHLKSRIIAEIDKIANVETENLVLTPRTLDEYLRIVGRVQGLRLAIELIEETYQQYMKE